MIILVNVKWEPKNLELILFFLVPLSSLKLTSGSQSHVDHFMIGTTSYYVMIDVINKSNCAKDRHIIVNSTENRKKLRIFQI